MRAIYELEDVVSIFGLAIALSFAAYLAGALSEAVFSRMLQEGVEDLRWRFFRRRESGFPATSHVVLSWRGQLAIEAVTRRLMTQLESAPNPHAVMRAEIPSLVSLGPDWEDEEPDQELWSEVLYDALGVLTTDV